MHKMLRNMTSLYLTSDNSILCLYRIGSRVANKKYIGSAGGHFEEGELNDPKSCVLREAWEELGLKEEDLEDLSLRYVTLRLVDNEIRQNYYYFARLKVKKDLCSTEGRLQWIAYDEVHGLDMPLSAKHMILHYTREGRYTSELYAGITTGEHTVFTVME